MTNPQHAKSRGGNPGSANYNPPGKPSAPAPIPAPRQAQDAHGVQLPLAGLELAEINADPWWWHNAWLAISNLATTGRPFSADDLRDGYGIGEPDAPCRWGALFAAAHRAGLIQPTGGIAVSRRRSRASGIGREWVGAESQRSAAASIGEAAA